MLEALRDYDMRDYDHEVRAQYPNPIGTPQRHRIRTHRFKIASHRVTEAEGETNMATKKEVEAPAKKEKKPEAPKMWGTKDVAKQLGVDPKFFRSVLRAAGKGSEGQRYEWKIGDPLKAERKMIEEYKERQEERKANAAAKTEKEKAAKKSRKKAAPPAKKAAKKAKKAEPEEEVEETEVEEEEAEEME